MFVHLWQGTALPTLLFLAGLRTIPGELYEAAAIDGAKSITVACLIPTLSVVPVVKQGLMVFDCVKSMTGGSPGTVNPSISRLICTNGFVHNKYSCSSATGLLIAAISFVQLQLSGRKKVA